MREGFVRYTHASPRVYCFFVFCTFRVISLAYSVSDRSVYIVGSGAAQQLALRLQIVVGDENQKNY